MQCGTIQTVQENILSHIILATYRMFIVATVRFTQNVSCNIYGCIPLCLHPTLRIAQFAYIPVCLHPSLPTSQFAYSPVCLHPSLPTAQFAYNPVCLQPSLPTIQFAYTGSVGRFGRQNAPPQYSAMVLY